MNLWMQILLKLKRLKLLKDSLTIDLVQVGVKNKKNFLRQPILVVDSSAMYQAKINKTILFLTLAMLALTAFAEIVDPLKIHDIIKLTALFGLLIFLLIWYYDP